MISLRKVKITYLPEMHGMQKLFLICEIIAIDLNKNVILQNLLL